MVNFLEYVSSQERKRRVRTASSPKEKMTPPQDQKRGSLVCGTVKTPIGSRVAKIKSRVLKRITKSDSALHKHVKWLKELQDERRRIEEMKEAEEMEQIIRRRTFMEREAMKRATGKIERSESPGHEKESAELTMENTGKLATSTGSKAKEAENDKKKPVWCQSETAHEASELENESALLAFAHNLNFEQYTHDLELQTLMAQLKKRIKILELEKKKDETKLNTCLASDDAAQKKESLEYSVIESLPTGVENENEDHVDETASIANSVMSESSIKSIHSKKSLTELISKARGRMMVMSTIEEEGEDAISPPIFSTVTDDNGARMAEKKSIHKLAFKNRNPSV